MAYAWAHRVRFVCGQDATKSMALFKINSSQYDDENRYDSERHGYNKFQ